MGRTDQGSRVYSIRLTREQAESIGIKTNKDLKQAVLALDVSYKQRLYKLCDLITNFLVGILPAFPLDVLKELKEGMK